MIAIPFIYFIGVFAYFWSRQHTWNIDLAATLLLIIISFCAIMIDVNDIYGNYGINYESLTLPTLLLFCFQWTMVLVPLHYLSCLKMEEHYPVKEKTLYVFFILIALSSFVMIAFRTADIKEALIMDLADVRSQHYQDLEAGSDSATNYLLLPANIFTSTPFPTMALFFWFYMKAFMRTSFFLRAGILIASIVQAIIAIIMAGRAAMIYWAFDFFLLFSFFYQYLPRKAKRNIMLTAGIFGALAGTLFVAITLARFDGVHANRDPFESLYGYAGQHINNFCMMFVHGGNSPLSFDRIFPLLSKISGNTYDMAAHYELVAAHMPNNTFVNVFDTFGGEIYLDLGWFGYIIFFLLLFLGTLLIRYNWQALTFNRVFLLIVFIAFFTRGLFAWPFTHHYTTLALMLTFSCCYFFKYGFKI